VLQTTDNPLLMGRLLQKLREESNPRLLCEATAEYLAQVCGHPVVWIGLYDRADHVLRTTASISPGSRRLFAQEPIVLESGELLEQVVIERRLLSLPDISSEARAGRLSQLVKLGLKGALVLPIRHCEICYGVVLISSDQWGMTLAPPLRNLLAIVLGQLGTALHHLTSSQQQQRQKRPDEPLLRLLDELRNLPHLQDRLDRITLETHQFIRPIRTSLYWYDSAQRRFERRHSQPQSAQIGRGKNNQVTSLGAADHEGFYRALQADRLLGVSDSQSAVNADMGHGLLNQLDARSALIAPINLQGLKGFIAVTGDQPRIWSPEEKAYLSGVAQLVALFAPLTEIELEIGQAKGDQLILAELSQAINGDDDWASLLNLAADRLFTRLRVERLILLNPEDSGGDTGFTIAGQRQLGRRRAIAVTFGPLSALDRPLIGQGIVCIEDVSADLRLMAWRSALESGEVRSAMVSPMSAQGTSDGILIVGHESPRSWNHADQDLLRNVAFQLGHVLRQRSLSQQLTEQQTLNQALQWGLTASQQERQADRLDWLMLQAIAQMLQSPVVALLTWPNPQAPVALTALATNGGTYEFPSTPVIAAKDRLLSQVIQSDGWLQPHRDTLADSSRAWLGQGGTILITALRSTSDAEAQGVILVIDQADRSWSERQLSLTNILVRQMAWSRRTLTQLTRLQDLHQDSELLNWYKQFWLQEAQRHLNQVSRSGETGGDELLETLAPLIAQESRKLTYHSQAMNLARFLKRSIERIDPLLRQRQLWHKVHGGDPSYRIQGDLAKLEAIVYEVLSLACDRCAPNSRLDIWCVFAEEQNQLQLDITDGGFIDFALLAALQESQSGQAIDQPLLETAPGLNLMLCQQLMVRLGGSLHFQALDDGRILSRFVIPNVTLRV
jgi:GAF domain-containing protein